MIKTHKITLTFIVFIYIPPIYIFWKSSPLPQSIVYFISTHTTKSHNKIIPQKYPKIPQQHSPKITLISQINLTLPLAILPITTYTLIPIQYNYPFNHPLIIHITFSPYKTQSTPIHPIYPHIKHIHTITFISLTPK